MKSLTTIKQIRSRQLLDCKCRPMVEVDVITEAGILGRGSAPTGSSVGIYESRVIRDDNPDEYGGLSVHNAVSIINRSIAPALIGMDVTDQKAIDRKMLDLDGTAQKARLGGNSIYSISIACARAAAASQGVPLYIHLLGKEPRTLPIPTFNFVNGGVYDGLKMAFNEFILVPYKSSSVEEAVEIGVSCFQKLGDLLKKYGDGHSPGLGHSFGYAAPTEDPEEVLKLMSEAAVLCGCDDKIAFALDCASSEMYDGLSETYYLNGRQITNLEQIGYVKELSEKYPFFYVEDLLEQNDWAGYSTAVRELPGTNIIGDDFIATSVTRLQRAYETRAVNGFILKPNQIGTITEALETYEFAKAHGLLTIPSGRSGGVIGDVVMDFAVGLEVPIIKNGAPRSGERIDKLNFLLRTSSLYPQAKLFDGTKLAKFQVQ